MFSQNLWSLTGGQFLYAEELKTLPTALNQISAGGIARQGVAAAITLMMMSVPIIVFIINQSKIVETMGTSGMGGSSRCQKSCFHWEQAVLVLLGD